MKWGRDWTGGDQAETKSPICQEDNQHPLRKPTIFIGPNKMK